MFLAINGRRAAAWSGLVVTILLLVALIFAARPAARLYYPLHYRAQLEQFAAPLELDPRLVAAIIRVESHFDPQAVSGKGARGLMQVLPATGQWVFAKLNIEGYDPDLLYDPTVSIQVGTWYMAYLLEQFDGKLAVALAAYNGGERNVRMWIESGLWNGELDTLDAVPFGQTRQYVRRIMRDYRVYQWLYPAKDGAPGHP